MSVQPLCRHVSAQYNVWLTGSLMSTYLKVCTNVYGLRYQKTCSVIFFSNFPETFPLFFCQCPRSTSPMSWVYFCHCVSHALSLSLDFFRLQFAQVQQGVRQMYKDLLIFSLSFHWLLLSFLHNAFFCAIILISYIFLCIFESCSRYLDQPIGWFSLCPSIVWQVSLATGRLTNSREK